MPGLPFFRRQLVVAVFALGAFAPALFAHGNSPSHRATPSPRTRERVGVRGPIRSPKTKLKRSDSRRRPLTLGRFASSTSPRTRGEVNRISFPRCMRIRVLLHATGTKEFQSLPKKRREAKRRKARSPRTASIAMRRVLSGGRSPSGASPRLSPVARRPAGSAPGHASWDADPAGATRLHLSQSRDCTSRTGRSTGVTDARSRPGAVRNAARRDRPRSTFESTLAKGPSVNEMSRNII
jgi:hypothetical protein